MTSQRFQRLEELFTAAADLRGEDRRAYLDSACNQDVELRRDAEALLNQENTDQRHLAGIVEDAAASFFDASSMAGVRLGAYRIECEIGRGGMGAVYLAVRADEEFDRRVAIKLVKRGIDTDAVLDRFRRERQILASLDHPYVARLIDGGTTADGRPYFVMEHIEGEAIHRYCKDRRLSVRERCELLRKVCEAVSYAHRNLIVHRDLKPGNILVTDEGVPKLLDFGIARLLTSEAGENTLVSGAALTPAYASPEQIRGEQVTTATDVYSLGAVLRDMFAGEKVPADLMNVIHMAMREEPDRRYVSADKMGDDIQAFLNGHPVAGRPDTLAYRAAMYVRRNRIAVVAGLLFLASLIGGLIAVSWQAHRAEQRLSLLVELANHTLFDVHGSIERLPGAFEARQQIVKTTVEYLDRVARDAGGDPRVRLALLSAYMRVGDIQGYPRHPNLDDLAGAMQSYLKARAILNPLLAKNPGTPHLTSRAVELWERIGQVQNALNRTADAESSYGKGIVAGEQFAARNSRDSELWAALAELYFARAELLRSLKPAAVLPDAERHLAIATRLLSETPTNDDARMRMASSYSLMGSVQNRLWNSDDALRYFRKSAEMRETLFAARPNDLSAKRDLMMIYGRIGDLLGSPFVSTRDDTRGALEYYRKADGIAESLAAADPADKLARSDLAIIWMRIGTVLAGPGELQESLTAFDRSEKLFLGLLAESPRNSTNRRQLQLVYEYRGARLWRQGDLRGALESYNQSLRIAEQMFAENPKDTSSQRQVMVDDGAIAQIWAAQGNRTGALALADKTLAAARQGIHDGREQYGIRAYLPRAMFWKGAVYDALKDKDAACQVYRQAQQEWQRLASEPLYKALAADVKAADGKVNQCPAVN